MRRISVLTASSILLVAFGCSNRYDVRLNTTLEAMKYAKKLDENLQAAPTEGALKEQAVYVRPPKPFVPAKEFGLGVVQPGLFDVEKTFFSGPKSALHVLARVKTQKKAPAKGAPADQPAPAARGNFNTDVLTVLKMVYGEDENIAVEKMKEDVHKPNTYKRILFTANDKSKSNEVYFYKAGDYDVALIFQFDPADRNAMTEKIKLCLASFAVGPKARSKYANAGAEGGGEEEAEAGGVVF